MATPGPGEAQKIQKIAREIFLPTRGEGQFASQSEAREGVVTHLRPPFPLKPSLENRSDHSNFLVRAKVRQPNIGVLQAGYIIGISKGA